MTSNDNEILLAVYENQVYLLRELQGVKAEQQEIRQEIQAVRQEQRVLEVRMDGLQRTMCWFFGAITLFLTAIALRQSMRRQRE